MEKETTRIEAFSDGVFAIAITLLVLDLHVPQFEEVKNTPLLLSRLQQAWPSYLAFTISFSSIFIMWVNHHKIFKQIYKRNSAVMFSNGLILFLVTCVSYPTALLSKFYNTASVELVVAIYTGMFVLINLSYNLLWFCASRHKELLRPGMTDSAIRKITRNYLYGLPTYLAAFATSFYNPMAALIICVSLFIFWALSSGKINLTDNESLQKAHF
ncbi:TMEM175 family protein [Dyadobacter sp. 3J3]|uniref:TMEM175 family protein n=1 Tax=Dyadobacter sp. 3J3 TaxID=2606600 RepID=UPI00135B80F6|nr:TMEM175 family protein [Dyadobacter sp. 3J3]